MLEPSGEFPVKFSVVEQGTEQEVKGFSAAIVDIGMKKLISGWQTDDYPNGREVMLPAGNYTFLAVNGPAEYTGTKEQSFMVDTEGNVFIRDSAEDPWIEKPDKLIRLEVAKGQFVTISTLVLDPDNVWHLPDVVFSLMGENGVQQTLTSGSEPMTIAVTPDVIYDIVVHYNAWSMQFVSGDLKFKVDSSGNLYLGDEDGQFELAPETNIVLVFAPMES